jgi:hypothetical protein
MDTPISYFESGWEVGSLSWDLLWREVFPKFFPLMGYHSNGVMGRHVMVISFVAFIHLSGAVTATLCEIFLADSHEILFGITDGRYECGTGQDC